ncbi:hypothetical protein [Tautonia sociabilis]|nr:hypothetical protein [Tautonia sociabilis]
MKFRLTPPELSERLPELRRGYFTGLDRTPEAVSLDLRPGLLVCHRDSPDSGRLHVPFPVQGFGMPFVSTATLGQRPTPYNLAVELARGKLNDIRGQAGDWRHLGLQLPEEVDQALAEARHAFSRAATSGDPERASESAQECLAASFRAGEGLTAAYTDQVIRKRLEHSSKLPTLLGCGLNADPAGAPWADSLAGAVNAARVRCSWAELAPTEGTFRWESLDAQIAWCQEHNLLPMAGPLLEFRPSALPDWLWLWSGDVEAIGSMALDLVRQAVSRYKGRLGNWHLVARPGTADVLGMNEEDQIRLAARCSQEAHRIDPVTPLIVDLDRPWAEWLGSSPYRIGPLHVADSLSRAEIGLAGVGLEVAPGYGPPGSHLRDLFEFSRLLDLFALLNQPLYVTISLPSASGEDPAAAPDGELDPRQWPGSPTEQMQLEMASRWISLAVAKPYVRAVIWSHASDAAPHLYAHAGLFRPDHSPKPLLPWLRKFRETYLV